MWFLVLFQRDIPPQKSSKVIAVCAFIGLFCRCVGLLCGQNGFEGSLEEPSHWRACLISIRWGERQIQGSFVERQGSSA